MPCAFSFQSPIRTVSYRCGRRMSTPGKWSVSILHPKSEVRSHPERAYLRLGSSTQKISPRQRKPQSVASELHVSGKQNLGRFRGHTFSRTLSKFHPELRTRSQHPTPDILKCYVADEKGTSDPVFFFGKRNRKLSATIEKGGAW